ncbi:MAG: hypothetical protein WC445_04350 [Patescibacteria group bacterium]
MAKSRKKSAAESFEFGNLGDLEAKRRAARRERKNLEKSPKEAKDWREELAEVGGKELVEKRRRGKAREAAIYSNLRTKYDQGILSKEALVDFLERFPSPEEYEAHERLAEAIREGEVKADIADLKRDPAETSRTRTITQRIRAPKEGRWVDEKKNVEVIRRSGIVVPTGTKAEQTTEEWYRKILREYALGELSDEDVQYFLSSFSLKEKEAYQKLLDEIKEKETRDRGQKDKLSREEIEEMLMRGLGFREELIKNIPTEEGKTFFDEMLDDQIEIFKGVLLDTVSRADFERKVQELGGDRSKAEQETITEAAKKFLAMRELFTHGVTGYDREKGQVVLQRYSDLDGKCAIALLGKAGLDIKNVGYLTAGEKKQGQITIDSGNADGLVVDSAETVDPKTGERKVEVTTVLDHHGPYSDRGTSATKSVYKVLTELGLLKFENEKEQKNYEKVVEWITHSDNFSFPEMEKYFQTSDRRMIGFLKSRFVTFDTLLRFSESGKDVADILDEKDLRRFGLIYQKKKGEVVDHTAGRREIIKRTMESVRELAAKGWLVLTKDGKRFIVDTQNKIGGEGQWAAASIGCDGVIRYTPETHNFFVALNKGTFDKETFSGLPQGRLVRGSVFIKLSGGEKLTVTLGDLLAKIAPDFKPGPKAELKRFLETESRRIRAIVSQSPEGWWWTNAPDGKKVIVKNVPKNFKSGGELYINLKESTESDRKNYGMRDFYVGFFEGDEIILPKKPAEKREVKTPAPVVERPKIPESERRREAERIIKQTLADERRRLFAEFLDLLEKSPIYKTRSRREKEEMARKQIGVKIEVVERELRKKYGL